MLVTQPCLTLCDPRDCSSPPGSSVHGILQARILQWVAIPFSGDLPDPGMEPRFPALQVDSLPSESPGKPHTRKNKSYLETSDNDLTSLLLNMNLKVIEQKAWILASKISDFIAYYL